MACCIVHVGCNCIFYSKYAVPTYETASAYDNTLNMTSVTTEDNNSEQEGSHNDSIDTDHSTSISSVLPYVCRLFMVMLFFAGNLVSIFIS
mmetsp:Transcript_5160/g.7631  ORF Transcript_5160/g.7631 Transcript_5160/m.7631 type:complete len:91 (-) Transcript_5160:1879-2151(-)